MRATFETLCNKVKLISTKAPQQAKLIAYGIDPIHTTKDTRQSYRPDIDGLRAIAVLAVVVYHAFPKHLTGGFAGVDVFFVISGFLITGIIHKGLKRGDFQFSDFWARRIRRIFPALLTVTVATLIAGWYCLLPAEFETLKSHSKWGLAFAANFKLNSEVGYFDVAAELKPLLHLWSLAIEEQFYLVWPLLLWICFRHKVNLFTVTLVLALLSYQSRKHFGTTASESFYYPWTRLWELQAGALLALWNAGYANRFFDLWNRLKKYIRPLVLSADASKTGHTAAPLVKSILSLVGLSLVVWSCVSFTKATPFPSQFTIFPVLGSVLIIAAGKDAWFNKWILSLRPMKFIGKISFPLYLWHWPILSFARIILGEPTFKVAAIAIVISFVLSILTYFLVEQKIRFNTGRLAWQAPALSTGLCVIVLWLQFANTKPRSAAYGVEKIDAAVHAGMGFPRQSWKQLAPGVYQIRTLNSRTTVFVGDSYLHQYAARIEKITTENPTSARSSVHFDFQGCFVPTGLGGSPGRTASCKSLLNRFNEYLEDTDQDVSEIVYSNHWLAFKDSPEFRETLRDFLKKLLTHSPKVTVILPHPFANGYGRFNPDKMVIRETTGFRIDAPEIDRKELDARRAEIVQLLKSLSSELSFHLLDPYSTMCSTEQCPTLAPNGYPMSSDGAHTSPLSIIQMGGFIDDTIIETSVSQAGDAQRTEKKRSNQ